MRTNDRVPMPAIAAGKGPFFIESCEEGIPPYYQCPTDTERGAFVVPLGFTEAEIAARIHGYGFLLLYKKGLVSQELSRKTAVAGLDESWVHTALCVAATSFLLARRLEMVRIHSLASDSFLAAEGKSKAVTAQLYLRCAYLHSEERIRNHLSSSLSETERELLDHATRELFAWGGTSCPLPETSLVELITRLQRMFGIPAASEVAARKSADQEINPAKLQDFVRSNKLPAFQALAEERTAATKLLDELFIRMGNMLSEFVRTERAKRGLDGNAQDGSRQREDLQKQAESLQAQMEALSKEIHQAMSEADQAREAHTAGLDAEFSLNQASLKPGMEYLAEVIATFTMPFDPPFSEHIRKVMPAIGVLFPEVPGLWGKMEVVTLPLTERHVVLRQRGRRFRPMHAGVFRYPHRALPGMDGAVFGLRRAKGGTILIDCSASTEIKQEDVEELLNSCPMGTVALYAGNRDGLTGSLAVVARKGKMASTATIGEWLRNRGGSNIIDGPALRWLIKQGKTRVWISDGEVTGILDQKCLDLLLESRVLIRKGGIKTHASIDACLAH